MINRPARGVAGAISSCYSRYSKRGGAGG